MSKLEEIIKEKGYKAAELFCGYDGCGNAWEGSVFIDESDLRELGKTHVVLPRELLKYAQGCVEHRVESTWDSIKHGGYKGSKLARLNVFYSEAVKANDELKAMIQASE